MQSIVLKHGGQPRRYLLWRAAAKALPLMVFLPGTGGTAEWAADECRLPFFAALNGFSLVVAEALPPDPSKPSKFLTNPTRWNDGSLFSISETAVSEMQTINDDVDFLTVVIRDAIERSGADAARVYLSGFSNGAGMTFRFAAERAELLAGIAPVAGLCWANHAKPSRPVPTIYLIGDADPLVPLRGGAVRVPWGNRLITRPPATLEHWAIANGCDAIPTDIPGDPSTIETYSHPAQVPFQSVIIAGQGHHWPGGKGQLNPRIGGAIAENALDANRMIWDFFESIG